MTTRLFHPSANCTSSPESVSQLYQADDWTHSLLSSHILFLFVVPIIVNGIKSACLTQVWQENWPKYNLKKSSTFCLSRSLLYSHHLQQSLVQSKLEIKVSMSSNLQRQEIGINCSLPLSPTSSWLKSFWNFIFPIPPNHISLVFLWLP